jgi:hypothetical protein
VSEIYRKFGRVVRFEHGRLLSITEAGEAIENGDTFIATPLRAIVDLPEPTLPVIPIANAERVIASSGLAFHRFGDIEWREETRRLHVSLVHNRIRALIDLDDFDFDLIAHIAERLARAGSDREAPQRIRLAPGVADALLPSLIGVAPPNVEIWQTGGGRDGKGQLIERVRITEPPWPNWYRPSYRVRPIRNPLNLAAVCDVTEIDRNLPEAIALLAPVDGLSLRVLIDDGRDAYPASVRVVRIDAVAANGEIMLG